MFFFVIIALFCFSFLSLSNISLLHQIKISGFLSTPKPLTWSCKQTGLVLYHLHSYCNILLIGGPIKLASLHQPWLQGQIALVCHPSFSVKDFLDMRYDVAFDHHKQMKGGAPARSSSKVAGNFVKMTDLQNKILTFRDLLDLSPCISSATANQLMIWTLKDLSRLYTNVRPSIPMSELERSPMHQVLNCFCGVLKSIGDLWTNNGQWMVKCKYNVSAKREQDDLEHQAMALIEDVNNLARERLFDMMDEDEQVNGSSPPDNAFGDALSESYSDSAKTSMSSSPVTPTSVLPDVSNALSKGKNISYAQPLLLSLRVQAVEKLNPIDLKRLSFHMFSHVVAQEPKFLNQKNETDGVQKMEIPEKYETEVTVEGSDETTLTFEMEEEMSIAALAESEKNNGENWTIVADAKPTSDAYPPEKLHTDDFQPPLSLRRLRPKAFECVTTPPPEQSALLSPNGVLSPIAAIPAPPPAPMFSRNEVLSRPQPQAPSSEPISRSPDIPQNLKTRPPPPPPPPPSAAGNKSMLPPPPPRPPMTSNSIIALRPPPPPPPPPIKSSNTMAFPPSPPPPPPITSSSTLAFPPPPPPPPPPITSSSTLAFPPPPPPPLPPPITSTSTMPMAPPPPTPVASRTITRPPPPPPPPSALGNFASPPPPPSPTMATGNMAPPPPPPPIGTSNRGMPTPPPPMPIKMGSGPPPPPGPGGLNNLRPKKAVTKLKRSSQMGHLYRLLKGKVEGSCLEGKTPKKGKIGAASGGKQGMADALAEMTKRSAYFQQIEEDVKNHAKSIRELKVSINSFKNSDMAELQNFHRHVESHLEKLTDETQVLARFEDFPTKKLETLRMAAALYSKLDAIATTLKNWQVESPVNQLLDKIENYFNKIKVQLDALERTKDEESKKFHSQNIQFDFSILIRIKELMVDVSSGCMELALKEGREAKAMENTQNGVKTEGGKKGSAKALWRAFQFAYRVYTFAGGYDDRADMLTRELAQEIETNPSH